MSMMDQLEGRRLMAADVIVNKATLTVNGTAGADTIVVNYDGKHYQIQTATGEAITTLTIQQSKAIKRIKINGLAGDDKITVGKGVTQATTVTAGDGDDKVDVYGSGSRTIDGGAGDDKIRHLAAGGTLGSSNFRYVSTSSDGDQFAVLPSGTAWRAASGGGTVTIDGSAPGSFLVVFGSSASITGGAGDDVISTVYGGDTIDGGAGDDRLIATGTIRTTPPPAPTPVTTPSGTKATTISIATTIYSVNNESIVNS